MSKHSNSKNKILFSTVKHKQSAKNKNTLAVPDKVEPPVDDKPVEELFEQDPRPLAEVALATTEFASEKPATVSTATAPEPLSTSDQVAGMTSAVYETPAWTPSFNQWAQQINPEVLKPLLVFGGGALLVNLSRGGSAWVKDEKPTPVAPQGTDGRAIDGYLAHALVWRDTNGNGQWDAQEPHAFTDSNGAFSNLPYGTGTIRITGLTAELRAALNDEPAQATTDISTGQAFVGVLSAPEGATVITPLTTLIVATGSGTGQAALKTALGIPAGIDLANFDPLYSMVSGGDVAQALAIQASGIQVASLMAMAVSTLQSLDGSLSAALIVGSVANNLAKAAQNSGATQGGLMLDSAVLQDALTAAAQTAATQSSLVNLSDVQSTLASASSALASINTVISQTVSSASAGGAAMSLATALGALTDVVASQLVSAGSLLTAVLKSAASGGDVPVDVGQFSNAALAEKINLSKSAVATLVVTGSSANLMVAIDDFGLLRKSGTDWATATGNLFDNDLSGGGVKTLNAAQAGATTGATSLNSLGSANSLSLQGQYGTLTLQSEGSYTYRVKPKQALNALVTDTFTYAVKSGSVTDLGLLTVSIDARNKAPQVSTVSALAQEAGGVQAGTNPEKINLLAAATDPNGDTLSIGHVWSLIDGQRKPSVDGVAQGRYGTLSRNEDGSYRYVLDQSNKAVDALPAGIALAEKFVFAVEDGIDKSESVLTVTIKGANDAPVMTSGAGPITLAENTQTTEVLYTALATDVDAGAALKYSLSGADASKFNINANTGVVTFKSAPDFEAPSSSVGTNTYSFNVVANDGELTASQSIIVSVSDVNEAPVISSARTVSVRENTADVVYEARATDPDADSTLTYRLEGADASKFNINASTGAVTFKSLPDFEAPGSSAASNAYTFSVLVSDGQLNASQSVVLNVANVNEAPIITSASTVEVNENTPTSMVVYTAVATDVDAGTLLRYSLSGADASKFNINTGTGAVTFQASPDFEANGSAARSNTYSFNVVASDGALTASEAVTLTVNNVNEAAVSVGALVAQKVISGTEVAIVLPLGDLFKDPDAGDALSYSVTGLEGSGLTFDPVTQTIKGTAASVPSRYTVSVTATDQQKLTAVASFALQVAAANALPELVQPDPITVTDTPDYDVFASRAGTLSGRDTDFGDVLTYGITDGVMVGNTISKSGDFGVLILDKLTGEYTYRPNASQVNALLNSSTDTFTVSVSDGLEITTKTLTVTLVAANDAPVLDLNGSAAGVNAGVVTFNENSAALPLALSALTLSDVDSSIASATATISVGKQEGDSLLMTASTGMGNIIQNYVAQTGVLTLSSSGGSATLAQWQVALKSIAFVSASDNPKDVTRTIRLQLTDSQGSSVLSNTATAQVKVNPINDAPILSWTTDAVTRYDFSESAAASDASQAIDIGAGLSLIDPDMLTPAYITVSFAGGAQSGDLLVMNAETGIGDIRASFAAGVLTLSSATRTATTAQFMAALDSVTYRSTSEAPMAGARNLEFRVNDGIDNSNVIRKSITVRSSDDLPSSESFTLTLAEDTPRALTLNDFSSFSDRDGDPLAFVRVKVPTVGQLSFDRVPLNADTDIAAEDIVAGRLEFHPAENAKGNAYSSFQYQVGTLNGADKVWGEARTITVNVTPVNDAPTLVSTLGAVALEFGKGAIAPIATAGHFRDIDDDALTYSARLADGQALPAGLSINAQTGEISGTPSAGWLGTKVVQVTATDTSGASVSAELSLSTTGGTQTGFYLAINSLQMLDYMAGNVFVSTASTGAITDGRMGVVISDGAHGADIGLTHLKGLLGQPSATDVPYLRVALVQLPQYESTAAGKMSLSALGITAILDVEISTSEGATTIKTVVSQTIMNQITVPANTVIARAYEDVDHQAWLDLNFLTLLKSAPGALAPLLTAGVYDFSVGFGALPVYDLSGASVSTLNATVNLQDAPNRAPVMDFGNGDQLAITLQADTVIPFGALLSNASDPNGGAAPQVLVGQPSTGTLLYNGVSLNWASDSHLVVFNGTKYLAFSASDLSGLSYRSAASVADGDKAQIQIFLKDVKGAYSKPYQVALGFDATTTIIRGVEGDAARLIDADGKLDFLTDGATATVISVPGNGVLHSGSSTGPVIRAGATLTSTTVLYFDPLDTVSAGQISSPLLLQTTSANGAVTYKQVSMLLDRLPTLTADENTGHEDTVGILTGKVLTNDSDPDGDALLVTGIQTSSQVGSLGQPLSGAFGSVVMRADGGYSWTASSQVQTLKAGAVGSDTFQYTVSDGHGGQKTSQLVISITGANDAPQLQTAIADQEALEAVAYNFQLAASTFSDVDGDALRWTVVVKRGADEAISLSKDSAYWLKFDPATRTLSGTPLDSDKGDYTVTVTASDSSASAQATYVFTVLNTDQVVAQDGYLVSALVWRDSNGDGVWNHDPILSAVDANHDGKISLSEITYYDADGNRRFTAEYWGMTDQAGNAPPVAGTGVVKTGAWADGGVTTMDLSTGKEFTGVLSAPEGATMVTPLTSMIASALSNSAGATPADIKAAQDKVMASLGIDPTVDLLALDPLAAASGGNLAAQKMALNVQKSGLQMANLMKVIQEVASAAGVSDMPAVLDSVNASLSSAGTLDYSSMLLIKQVLANMSAALIADDAVQQIISNQSEAIASALSAINKTLGQMVDTAIASASGSIDVSALLTDVVAAQIVAQQNVAAQVGNSILLAVQTGNVQSTGAIETIDLNQAINAARSQVGSVFVASADTVNALAVNNNGRSTYSANAWSTVNGNLLTNDIVPDGYVKSVNAAATGLESDVTTLGTLDTASTLTGQYGRLLISANGEFVYTVDPAKVSGLAINSFVNDSFTYRLASTKSGQSALSDLGVLTVTIDKTNMSPVVAVARAAVTEAGLGILGSGATVIDLLAGSFDSEKDTLTVDKLMAGNTTMAGGELQGQYGVLRYNAGTGQYSYSLSQDMPIVNSLKASDTLREVFTYAVSDGVNPAIATAVIIGIKGSNDAPVISGVNNIVIADTTANDTFTPGVANNLQGVINATDPEGEPLSYQLDGGSLSNGQLVKVGTYGTLFVQGNGQYIYQPDAQAINHLQAGDAPTESFLVHVTDASGASRDVTIQVNVTGANDQATFGALDGATAFDRAALIETNQQQTQTGRIVVSDADSANAIVAQSQTVGAYGRFRITASGGWSYTTDGALNQLSANQKVYDRFIVTTVDGSTHELIIAITGTNDAPVPGNVIKQTPINTAIVVSDILSQSSDAEGDRVTISSADLRSDFNGAGTLNLQDGVLTFTPSTNYSGTVFIDYKLRDVQGANATGTLTVVVGDNTVPRSANATVTADEDTVLQLTSSAFPFSDSDPGQSVLGRVIIKSLPSAGQLFTMDNDREVLVQADASFTQAQLDAGALKFRPAADVSGVAYASFNFQVVDSGNLSQQGSQVMTFNITPVNDAPVITSGDSFSVSENTGTSTVIYTVTSTDVDSATRTYSLAGNDAGKFEINGTSGAIRFKASPDFEHPDSVAQTNAYSLNVVANDGALTASKALTIQVTNVNEAPTAIRLSANTIVENTGTNGGVLIGQVTLDDADVSGNSNVLSLSGGADRGSFELRGSALYFIGTSPDFEAKTSYELTITSTDGSLIKDQTFTVQVSNVNEAPTAISLSADTIAENTTIGEGVKIGDITVVDPEGASAQNVLSLSDNDNFKLVGQALYFKGTSPDYEKQNQYSITVTSTDGALRTSQMFTVNVSNENDNPTVLEDTNQDPNVLSEAAQPGTALAGLDLQGRDADTGAHVTLSLTDDAGGLFVLEGTQIKLSAGKSLDYETQTQHTITVLATSTDGSAVSQDVVIQVGNVNDNELVLTDENEGSNTLEEDALDGAIVANLSLQGSDADAGAQVTLRLTNDAGGLFVLEGNQVKLKLEPNQSLDYESQTRHTITVLATSTDGSTVSHDFVIEVINVNEAPKAKTIQIEGPRINEDASVQISQATLLANYQDPEGSLDMRVAMVSGAVNGQVQLNADGSVSFTPNVNYFGPASFSYVVRDASGAQSEASTVSLNVTNVNDPVQGRVLVQSSDATNKVGATLTALPSLTDADGLGALSYQWQQSTDDINWSPISGANGASFTTTASQLGARVRVHVSYNDQQGADESTDSNVLTVVAATSTNRAPALTGTAYSVPALNEDGSFTITLPQLLQGYTDADERDSLRVQNLQVTHATVAAISEAGQISAYLITPTTNFNGTLELSYEITDGAAQTAVSRPVTVQAVNDAPTLVTALADQVVAAGESKTFTIAANAFADVDSAPLTYTATWANGLPLSQSWLSFDSTSRTFTARPLAAQAGVNTIRVTTSDGHLSVSDDFNLTVTTPRTQAMLRTLSGELTDYQDITSNNVDYTHPASTTLGGLFNSSTGLLSFANTAFKMARGNVLALSDGVPATVGNAPTLTLALANLPAIESPVQSRIEIALTSGTDATKASNESQVKVELNIETLLIGGQIVMRAESQTATVHVINSSGSINVPVSLNFSNLDVIASSSTSSDHSALNFNVMGLLSKLDGTFYGGLLGIFLSDGNFTLSIVKKSGGDLPLQTDAGQQINGFTVGVPISSEAPNAVPEVRYGTDISALQLAMPAGQTLALGSFLLNGAGLDSSSTPALVVPRFQLTDADGPQDLNTIWLFKPGQGALGLLAQDSHEFIALQDAQYQVLGGEKVYALAISELSRLVYAAPLMTGESAFVTVQFMLEDQAHVFSTIQSAQIELNTRLHTSQLVTEGSSSVSVASISYDSVVLALPTQGKLYAKAGDGTLAELSLGSTAPAGSTLVYDGPAENAASLAEAGQLVLRGFDAGQNTYTISSHSFRINHLPSIAAGSTPVTLSEDASNTSTVLISLADQDAADTLHIDLNGWTLSPESGAFTKSLAYGVVSLSPVIDQRGQFTLSYAVDARAQALAAGLASDPVSLTVLDAQGASRTTTVTFTVQGLNDGANFAAQAGTPFDQASLTETDAIQTVVGRVLVSDVDGPSLVISQTKTSGTYGWFSVDASGQWRYETKTALNELRASQHVDDQFTITTEDGSVQRITVHLEGTNDAPKAANQAMGTFAINTSVSINLLNLGSDTDAQTDELTVTQASLMAGQGTLTLQNGMLTFVPSTDFSGVVEIGYTIQDQPGLVSQGKLTLVVGDNSAPTSSDNTLTQGEDSIITLTAAEFLFEDKDLGQTLGWVIIKSLPSAGQLFTMDNDREVLVQADASFTQAQLDAGALKFRPAADVSGVAYASFNFQVVDSGNLSQQGSQVMTFNITPVNDAPVITSGDSFSVSENTGTSTVIYTVTSTDVDSATRTYSLAGNDAGKFEINGTSGAIRFKASPDFEHPDSVAQTNAYSLNVVANDGALTASKALTIQVTNVNEAPTAIRLSANTIVENTITGDGIKVGDITITDPDAAGNQNVLTLSDNDNFKLLGNALYFKGVSADFETHSSYNLTVTSTDGSLVTARAFTIGVTDLNEAPTSIALTGQTALQENNAAAIVVGTIDVSDPDVANAFTHNLLSLTGADAQSFEIIGNQLVFKAGQTVDYETQQHYSVSVVANAGQAQQKQQNFSIAVDNTIDTVTLASNNIRLTDHDSSGRATTTDLKGLISGPIGDASLTYALSSVQGSLSRTNLQQLFDGDPLTGKAPSLEFLLQDTTQIATGTHTLHLNLGMSNSRFGNLQIATGFDVQVQFTRDAQNQLHMALPSQTIQMQLSAGGQTFASVALSNLDRDMLSLDVGSNGLPSLTLKLDNLLDKASDNALSLADLSETGLVALAGSAAMSLLGGKSLGDLIGLAKEGITFPAAIENTKLSSLMHIVQDALTLPAELQHLSFEQTLTLAGTVLNLPANLSLGSLLSSLRTASELPASLQGSLGSIKASLVNTAGAQTVQDLEALARTMLGSDGMPFAGQLSDKTIPQILDMLAGSHIGQQGLAGLINTPLSDDNAAQLLQTAARLVNAIYGDKTLGQMLYAAQDAVTLTPELSALQTVSLSNLLSLSSMAVGAVRLLGADQMSVLGLLQLVKDAVTIDGALPTHSLNNVLQILDGAFDLTPLLGRDYSLTRLATELQSGKVTLGPLLSLASQALLSSNGQLTATLDLPAAMGLTEAGGQVIRHIVVEAPVKTIDALSLHTNQVQFIDVDLQGQPTSVTVDGTVANGVMSFNMSTNQSGLNRVNLLQLLDGNPTTGISPTVQFELKDTANVQLGTSHIELALSMGNDRLMGMSMGASIGVDIRLTRDDQGQLQIVLPAQSTQLHLTAAGLSVLHLPVGNVSADMISLVSGDNGVPSLSLKINNLIDKAADNKIAFSDLDNSGAMALAAGAVMGLLGGKNLGDLLSLAKDQLSVPDAMQDNKLSQLLHIVQNVGTLPSSLQNLSFDQVMLVAADVLKLPANLELGTLLRIVRDAIELPDSLQGTLGQLKTSLQGSADAHTVQALEDLTRAMLASASTPYAQDLADKTIAQLLDMLADSPLAQQDLASLAGLGHSYLGGINAAELLKDGAHVIDALYGDQSLAHVLAASQDAIVLVPELAQLGSTSLSGLLNLTALSMNMTELLGPGNLSIVGLLDLVRQSVTVDGVISGHAVSDVLHTINGSFDLSSLLGADYSVSDLYADLQNNQIALQPLIGLAGKTLLGEDGQASVTVSGLSQLGLTSADGATLQQIVLKLALDDKPNTAGQLSLVEVLASNDVHFDLGAAIGKARFSDSDGDTLAGVFIDTPWAGTLKLNGQVINQDHKFVSLQDLSEGHLLYEAPVSAGQAVPLSLDFHLCALDSRGALSEEQKMQVNLGFML